MATIVIHIVDGCVQSIVADGDVRVLVCEEDIEGVDINHPHYVAQIDAILREETVDYIPSHVSRYVKLWEL